MSEIRGPSFTCEINPNEVDALIAIEKVSKLLCSLTAIGEINRDE